jgi:small subunit ribosomal protein S19e
MYGGGKRIGYGGIHHRQAGGSAVRKALHQLESAGLVSKKQGKGRFLTSRGRSLLDRVSNEIFKELLVSNPSMKRYA